MSELAVCAATIIDEERREFKRHTPDTDQLHLLRLPADEEKTELAIDELALLA